MNVLSYLAGVYYKSKVLRYYKKNPNDQYQEELDWLAKNKWSSLPYVFPYDFEKKHCDRQEVFLDADGFPFVVHEGKKLFFPKAWSKNRVSKMYTGLLMEQDPDSPHRYEDTKADRKDKTSFCVKEGDILADIGSAEGIFSLTVIEHVKKVYLFEFLEEWIEPLRRTFAPFSDKVEIVKKFVSNKTNTDSTTLDDFFAKQSRSVDFLKMDVEGHEAEVLGGAAETMKKYQPRIAVCVYHKPSMPKKCQDLFDKNDYIYKYSHGFMLWFIDAPLLRSAPPFFRRGLLRAEKAGGSANRRVKQGVW